MSRQKYLRQQRDRIVEIKRKTRVKQLAESLAQEQEATKDGEEADASLPSSHRRPTSAAQAARQILDQPLSRPSSELLQQPEEQEALNSALQVRRTLAQRLKTEVVEQQT